jgi:peptidoglycan hydrolase-like protein with peptidoglycan-binding domain
VYARLPAKGLPDLDVRAVQMLLTYHGFDPRPFDGASGPRTKRAAAVFAEGCGLGVMRLTDPSLRAALIETLPTPPRNATASLPDPIATPEPMHSTCGMTTRHVSSHAHQCTN